MLLLTAAALAAAVVLSCSAGERSRRFTVALTVLAGDARLLVDTRTTARRRQGLHDRIASSLSTLGLLARQYLQERGERSPQLLAQIERLESDFRAGRLHRFEHAAADLARRYPLNMAGLRPEDARPEDIAHGRQIYRRLCMGCHAYTDRNRANPAQDLVRMAHRLPEREFVARLLGGVHGTPAVALHNPLSDSEIAGLAAYLRNSPSDP
jgi:mono/diheme cytochrome c family protein